MRCPECETDNTEDSRFCRKCATPLPAAGDLRDVPTLAFSSPQPELTPGTTFAGRYLVIEEIGQGGMGRIYKVLDKEINERVSLKLIKPEIAANREVIERFQNEIRITRKISHKNICRMYHLSREKDTYYITMEYVSGENLKNMIRMTKQMSIETALDVGRQVCQGLAEAHRLGIVHRDLKPQNIMIDEDGNVRILDFGIARSIETRGATTPGMMIGTPEYMSPEQIDGGEVDQRTDIYSLGLLLFEMLTGRPPFEGENSLNVIYKQKHEAPRDPRTLNAEVSASFSRVILKCLEKQKELRYQTAEELLADLSSLQQEHAVEETRLRTRRLTTVRPRAARMPTKKIAVGTGLLAAAIVLGVLAGKSLFRRAAPALADNPVKVAVISFANQTGDPSYDYLQEAIPNLLITSLEQGKTMRITSWERLRDLLKQTGREDQPVIDRDIGFEICRIDGIQAIILGSFVRAGDVFVTDAKILDVGTKSLLKSVSSRGDGVDSILRKQIDELSREITKGFSAEEHITQASASSIAEATTNSMEAYNYFLRGREAYEKFYFADARRDFEQAVDLDPEFATAYSYLFRVYDALGNAEAARDVLEKLRKYGSRVSGKEGLYIQALLARYVERSNDKYVQLMEEIVKKYPEEKRIRTELAAVYNAQRKYEPAVAELKKVLELDPQYGFALNLLAYAYGNLNQFDEAIKYFQLYASVSPGDANPHDSLGELYFRMGKLDQSRKEFMEAVRIRPDFGSGSRISYIHSLSEDYAGALNWLDQFVSAAPSSGHKQIGFQLRALYHSFMGNVGLALEELDQARQYAAFEKDYNAIDSILRAKIWICYDWGKFDLFHKHVQERYDFRTEYKLQPELPNATLRNYYQGVGYLKEKKLDLAKAKLAEVDRAWALEKDNPASAWMNNAHYHLLSELCLLEGRANEGVEADKRMQRIPVVIGQVYTLLQRNVPLNTDFAARAYVLKGEIDKAIAEYERLTSADSQLRDQILVHPHLRFRLARLYEEKGERARAVKQYQILAEVWKDADQDLTEVQQVRRRLAALKG
jgi:serine/threonine protein kinase/Flp pilus assembly protein TadD